MLSTIERIPGTLPSPPKNVTLSIKPKVSEVITELQFQIALAERIALIESGHRDPNRTAASMKAERKFLNIVRGKGGWTETCYISNKDKVIIACGKGHKFSATPGHVNSDGLWCSDCPNANVVEKFTQFQLIVDTKKGQITLWPKRPSNNAIIKCCNNHEMKISPLCMIRTGLWCETCDLYNGISHDKRVLNVIQFRKGKLLNEYKNITKHKLLIECEGKHLSEFTSDEILKGKWCKTCNEPKCNAASVLEIITSKGGKQLTPFINSGTNITIQCSSDHIWSTSPGHIYYDGSWCLDCPKQYQIDAKNRFIEEVARRGGVLLTEYTRGHDKVIIRCDKLHEFPVEPNSVMSMESWCPKCNKNCPKQAAERFYAKVAAKGGIAIGEYVNAYTRVLIMCDKKHQWSCIPHDITSNNTWCSKCSKHCPIQARENFLQIVENKGGVILGEYVNTSTKLLIKCKNEHSWYCLPGQINHGYWCRACAGNCPIEAYRRLVRIVADREGEILDDYINSQTKIRFKCKLGHIWETDPTNITNSGSWCSTCNESHGERSVRQILSKHNIEFLPQRTHHQLARKQYDFRAIHNGKTYYIEYDGEQHFRYVEYFCKTIEKYEQRREVDVLKTNTVLQYGDYIIRLDFSLSDKQLEEHLLKALNSNERLYLSNPPLYQWIIDGLQFQPSTQTIIQPTTQAIIQPMKSLNITSSSVPVQNYTIDPDLFNTIAPLL